MKKRTHAIYRLFAILLAAAGLLTLTACGKSGPPTIGISQYGEHGSLDNCREGFLQGLADAGLTEGTDFTVSYQNAGFDNSMTIEIANSFAANKVDMMCAIATPSATACYAACEEKNIPLIYTAINDPQAAGLVGGNATGTSDKLPVEAQLELIRTLQPTAGTIGIIYTTSEPNSVSTIAEYQEKAREFGFAIDAIGVTAQSEVTQATDTLLQHGVDCFCNLTDNNVVGVLSSILEKTDAAGVPVYGSEIEQVKLGCAASAGIDYYELGRQTGAMAAKVLKGEAQASDIPFEVISSYSIYINSEVTGRLGITVPQEITDRAIECAEG